MIRGIYTAASGMVGDAARLEIIANNLANVSTPGFKRELALYRAAPDLPLFRQESARTLPLGPLTTGAFLENTFVLPAAGPLRPTGMSTDIALLDDIYLAIWTPTGERYTRHGGLQLSAEGWLLTATGDAVLGEGGEPLQAGTAADVRIAADGTVYSGETQVGRLRLVRFAEPMGLLKEGANLLAATQRSGMPEAAEDGRLSAGFLEESNVDPVGEMVAMIVVMRAYEANQQVVKAQDEALGRGVQVGKLV